MAKKDGRIEDNQCRTCEHWKWHSRKQDVEPMHSVGFHYCEMISMEWKKSTRLIICAAHGYYKQKNQELWKNGKTPTAGI